MAVNERFAKAVIEEAKTDDPVVLVQDYHFALLPKMVREKLPNATIIVFWHIPWPNAESYGICPWRQEILEGLLGAALSAFTPANMATIFSTASIVFSKRASTGIPRRCPTGDASRRSTPTPSRSNGRRAGLENQGGARLPDA